MSGMWNLCQRLPKQCDPAAGVQGQADTPHDRRDYRNKIGFFIGRIIGREDEDMEMEIRFPGGKKVEALFNDFTVKTDQPVVDGGSGSAPSPFDLFLASIGTCTGYYVLSFCQKNNIPTQNITLHASMQRNKKTHLVEHCIITIHVPKDFPKKYENAVIKSAEVCTVKRHLASPPTIDIKVASH